MLPLNAGEYEKIFQRSAWRILPIIIDVCDFRFDSILCQLGNQFVIGMDGQILQREGERILRTNRIKIMTERQDVKSDVSTLLIA